MNGSTSVKAMKNAYDDVCDMYMGKQDCSNKAQCVDDALSSDGPSDPCVDDTDFLYKGKSGKDCKWEISGGSNKKKKIGQFDV